jgi:hypothetical protein
MVGQRQEQKRRHFMFFQEKSLNFVERKRNQPKSSLRKINYPRRPGSQYPSGASPS